MQRKSVDRMALVLSLAGLLLLTGCHKKNRHDMAQDDEFQSMEQGMEPPLLAEYEDQAQAAQPMPESMPQVVPDAPAYTSYTVQRGDTLWSIAKQHYNTGQRWKDIVAANPGLDPAKLKIGQQIMIP